MELRALVLSNRVTPLSPGQVANLEMVCRDGCCFKTSSVSSNMVCRDGVYFRCFKQYCFVGRARSLVETVFASVVSSNIVLSAGPDLLQEEPNIFVT